MKMQLVLSAEVVKALCAWIWRIMAIIPGWPSVGVKLPVIPSARVCVEVRNSIFILHV